MGRAWTSDANPTQSTSRLSAYFLKALCPCSGRPKRQALIQSPVFELCFAQRSLAAWSP